MMQNLKKNGFTLVEMLLAIIVLGILAAVATNYMANSIDVGRRAGTEKEMTMLVHAIVGDPSLIQGGHRVDFGYFGDVGSFPPDLQALYTNPGIASWNGPYIDEGYLQDSSGFKFDAWGSPYVYNGMSLTSTGSGDSITYKVVQNAGDYLSNTFAGSLHDGSGNPPGIAYDDSVLIVVYFPDGGGGMTAVTANPNAAGIFNIGSVPAGNHRTLIIYQPAADTLERVITVFPRNKSNYEFAFAAPYFD